MKIMDMYTSNYLFHFTKLKKTNYSNNSKKSHLRIKDGGEPYGQLFSVFCFVKNAQRVYTHPVFSGFHLVLQYLKDRILI